MNVGIVGVGAIASEHKEAWSSINNTQIVALCDTNRELASKRSKEWNITRCYTKFSEMLDKEKLSFVSICTPPQTHTSLIIEAIEAGCRGIIVEKPMCITTNEAKKIIDHLNKPGKNVRLRVVHNWLYLPVVEKIKKKICEVGRINSMNIHILNSPKDPMISNGNHWCHNLSGGRIGEVLPHPIYLLKYFLGDLEVASVSCTKRGPISYVKSDEVLVTFKSGDSIASTYISFNSPGIAIILNIYGDDGIITADLIDQTFIIQKPSPNQEITQFDRGVRVLRKSYQLMDSLCRNMSRAMFHKYQPPHSLIISEFIRDFNEGVNSSFEPEEEVDMVRLLQQICGVIDEQSGT
jgi:predicted dehydrogenase